MSEINPTSVILFDAAVAYANESSDISIRSDLRIAFVAGAEWQWKRVEDDIAAKDADISELRAKLFPYADATEIGGISWDGKYLIGDKASIKFFHEMKNRGEQIDVYKRAYDQNLAAKDAEIDHLREALKPFIHQMQREFSPEWPDSMDLAPLADSRWHLKVGDFRRAARAALKEQTP